MSDEKELEHELTKSVQIRDHGSIENFDQIFGDTKKEVRFLTKGFPVFCLVASLLFTLAFMGCLGLTTGFSKPLPDDVLLRMSIFVVGLAVVGYFSIAQLNVIRASNDARIHRKLQTMIKLPSDKAIRMAVADLKRLREINVALQRMRQPEFQLDNLLLDEIDRRRTSYELLNQAVCQYMTEVDERLAQLTNLVMEKNVTDPWDIDSVNVIASKIKASQTKIREFYKTNNVNDLSKSLIEYQTKIEQELQLAQELLKSIREKTSQHIDGALMLVDHGEDFGALSIAKFQEEQGAVSMIPREEESSDDTGHD